MVNFESTIENLRETGFSPMPDLVYISVQESKKALWEGLKYFTKEKAVWLKEYDEIVKWLADNKGRGLLCMGNCGRGKSLISGKIIPILLNHYCRKIVSCYDAQQMNADIDKVKASHIIYIDDIGTESISVKYGERRLAFAELVDEAEKKGKLLIVSTNLSINDLCEKYGERTVDRLRAITTPVAFEGESLRK